MKTGGSYTRILGDLVWKKPSENRYIFNSAGWKLGLKNGRSFFKGKQNLPSDKEETWTSMSSRCPFCKVTVRCKIASPSAPSPSAPRPTAPRPTAPRPIAPRPIAPRPIAPTTVPLPQKCQRIRIRKDAHRLTQAEKRQLQHAMNGIIQDGTFQEIANYHGAPYGKICQLRYTDPKKKTG